MKLDDVFSEKLAGFDNFCTRTYGDVLPDDIQRIKLVWMDAIIFACEVVNTAVVSELSRKNFREAIEEYSGLTRQSNRAKKIMDDKELLELAAKAHGGLVYIEDCNGWIHEDAEGNRGAWWNPLTDDGDALRLAVKLGMDLLADDKNIEVDAIQHSKLIDGVMVAPWAWERLGNDPYAATRLAIVRAAAEIGREMK